MRMICVEKDSIVRPKNWVDVPDNSHEKFIENYFNKNIRIHDADNCGEDEYYFGISDSTGTKYYKLIHSWWIDYDPEWRFHNEKEIMAVDKTEASKYVCSDRDWIILR
jgi:hypothetical protein